MFGGLEALEEVIAFGLEFLLFDADRFVFDAPGFSAGGEVTGVDFEGLVLSSSVPAFFFPVVAAFENFGEEYSGG